MTKQSYMIDATWSQIGQIMVCEIVSAESKTFVWICNQYITKTMIKNLTLFNFKVFLLYWHLLILNGYVFICVDLQIRIIIGT